MYILTIQSSPSRTRANASFKLTPPVRIDLISVPVNTTPTSKCSRNSYSKRARRLSMRGSAAGGFVFGGACTVRVAPLLGRVGHPELAGIDGSLRHEFTVCAGEQRSIAAANLGNDAEHVAPLPLDAA